MILLDGVLSPGQLIIPALMLPIDLSSLLRSFKLSWSAELSLNKKINLSSIKRKTPTVMGRIYMVNTRLFWVHFYKPFLGFLSRDDPLAFVEELIW